ncbi:hypothetical protein GCM10011579_029500 [Streptomyces albiflavescens]|uniref:Uncharacterized protein n=1 Tax=Streptomyces albiflavescens TaxID=1623582 RepID=A0A918D2Z9_9ACTN|nr:hypothetical protein GCM10011579_029500 [Streptomyces albiflavescens]
MNARIKRQEVLYEVGKSFRVLIWEGALHAIVCPPPPPRWEQGRGGHRWAARRLPGLGRQAHAAAEPCVRGTLAA